MHRVEYWDGQRWWLHSGYLLESLAQRVARRLRKTPGYAEVRVVTRRES